MKKYIVCTFIIIACLTSLSAQTNQTGTTKEKPAGTVSAEPTAGEIKWANDRTDKLAAITGLTEEQRSNITATNLRFARRISVLQNSQTLAPEAFIEMKSNLFNYRMDEYKRTLTPEQAAKIETSLLELKADGDHAIE